MAYQIVWSAEAENDFKTIVLYLKENWSLQSSEKFITQAYRKIEKLSLMPSIANLRVSNQFISLSWTARMFCFLQ